jgi:uncharacterized membrane protein
MAFCVKCGTQLDDSVRFCTACGADQTPQGSQTYQTPPPQPEQPGVQQKAEETWKKFTDTADSSAEYDSKDIEDNKVMAFLSYLGILFLVPLLAAPNSKFARFHVNQGIVLAITEIAYSIVYSILTMILSMIPVLGGILIFILSLLWIVFGVLAILGIINAVNGKAKELPVIGKFKILK